MGDRSFTRLILCLLLLAPLCLAEKFWWEKMKAVKLTERNYKGILGKDKYVFVEFYSKSCGYCEELYPVLNKLIAEIETGKFPRKDIMLARIDAEEFTEVADELQVDRYPTIYLYKPNDPEYPEKYDYSHKLTHFKNYLSTHPLAPKFAKSNPFSISGHQS